MNIDLNKLSQMIAKPRQGLSERHIYIFRMALLLIVEHGWDAERATEVAIRSADIVFGGKEGCPDRES